MPERVGLLLALAAAMTSATTSRATRAKADPPRGGAARIDGGRLGPLEISKWRLDNGLEVILAPDPGATSVSYMTWFRVGSRNENEAAGETGLAHLFEHLMFTQTRGAKKPGEFDRLMEEVGGNTNAMTYFDFTAYIDELPPDQVDLAIRLEADRMVNLALTKAQVDNEREVVAEERLASVEDSVDGTLDEQLYKQSFRKHPYRWPVIGWMKDIRGLDEHKAVTFYRTFYAPNNAVVVVAGKIDGDAVLAEIVRRYGALPRAELPADGARRERAPAADARAAIERPVPADRLVVGFPAAALADADRVAYEVTAELLLGGPSSRLHRRLVIEHELASSVRGDLPPTRDPALWSLWIQLRRGHHAEEAETILRQELDRLARTPVGEEELQRARNRVETSFWRQLGSSHGKAEQLGQFEVSGGGFRRLLERAAELQKVDAAAVRRIATEYLSGPRSVVIATPKGSA